MLPLAAAAKACHCIRKRVLTEVVEIFYKKTIIKDCGNKKKKRKFAF